MHPNPADVLVYYHADCADGFGAAYAAWRRFGETARYQPIHHGMAWEPEAVRGRHVFILDFSFPREELLRLAQEARSVEQIDHHQSAMQDWSGLLKPDGQGWTYQHPDRPLCLHFDLTHSGAYLAWQRFHPNQALPLLLAHVEDVDLWHFALPESRAFSRALRLQPFDFRIWDEWVHSMPDAEAPAYRQRIVEGAAIEHFLQTEIQRLADSHLVMPVYLKGEPIDPLQAMRHGQPVLNAENQSFRAIRGLGVNANSLFASELGHAPALQSGTFGMIWTLAADGQIKASLRATGAVNVARIAQNYGGGGHPNAAGFRIPWSEFTSLLTPGVLPE